MLIFQQFACSNKTVREVYYTKLFIESNLDFWLYSIIKRDKNPDSKSVKVHQLHCNQSCLEIMLVEISKKVSF